MTIIVNGENTVQVNIDEFSALNAANSATVATQAKIAAQVSAEEALASQQASALSEANASASEDLALDYSVAARLAAGLAVDNYLGTLVTFAFLQDALNAYDGLNDGDIALIVSDERYNNKSTVNKVNKVVSSIDLDFANNQFETNQPIQFLNFFGLHRVAVPLTSTDIAAEGSFAFDDTYLYIATLPNSWKRITLESF